MIGYPLVATLVVALVSMLALANLPAVRAARWSMRALGVQACVAALPWMISVAGPREPNWSGGPGDTCLADTGLVAETMVALGFGAAAIGGLVLGSGAVAAYGRVARGRGAMLGIAAVALPYVAFVPLVLAVLCGMN
jgi:hypothetical protein